MKFPRTIRRKLLLAILPLVAFGVSGAVSLQYVLTRAEILPRIEQEIRAVAERGARNIDDLLGQGRHDLFTLSETPLISDYHHNVDYQLLDEAEAYRRELEQYFLHFSQRSQAYARILFLDKAGREACRIEGTRLGARRSDAVEPYFTQARHLGPGRWWTSSVVRLPDGRAVLYYAKPLQQEDELAGVLVLAYDLAQIASILKATKVGQSGQAFLQTSEGVFPPGSGLSGPHLLGAQSPLKELPWKVVVQAPIDEFLGPLRRIRDAAVFTAFLGIIVLLGVLLWLVRSITQPVAALAEAARRIGEGDLRQRIERVGDDELGALSCAFNDMAGSLESNRKLNNDLQAQLIQAEKLSAVGLLISSVAHELNTPLSTVCAGSQMILMDGCTPGQRLELERLKDNALRCSKVVENLLFFVRRGGRQKARIDLNAVVASALELLGPRLKKTEHVAVVLELEAEPRPAVGDLQQLVQVLINLINNACDAMEDGARPEAKRLVLRTGSGAGEVWLSASDSGPGVPAADRERIFEPFYTTKEPGRGTGLGLPICRQILESHGGSISLVESPQPGATFRLSLPEATEAELAALREPEAPAEVPAAAGRRVLVVEDDADLAEIIARLMREDGDAVDVALQGEAALDLLSRNAYDLVISDFWVDRVTGEDILAQLRQGGPSAAARILFVTGDAFNAKVLNFLHDTGLPYVVKPFAPGELRQAARRLLHAA